MQSKRKLTYKEFPLVSKMLNKMEIRKEINETVRGLTQDGDVPKGALETYLTIDIIMILLENQWKADNEFQAVLVAISDKKPEEIENLTLDEIVEIFSNIDLGDVFKNYFRTRK